MKIFVTGATGYIGYPLCMKLAEQGHTVHVLVRNPDSQFVPGHPLIKVFKGDILDRDAIAIGMEGCRKVFHVAAAVKFWSKDANEIFRANIDGTANILSVAMDQNVSRVVFTSTCGVIGPCIREPMSEDDPRTIGFSVDYELSKQLAENIVKEYVLKGLDVVIVSPSKIHGPGHFRHKVTLNGAIRRFLQKGFAFAPSPATYRTCFAFIDDVVNGHLLAMFRGKSGEKYILGGYNLSYIDFFNTINKLSQNNGRVIQLSRSTAKGWALLQKFNYVITGTPPSFTSSSVDHFFGNYCFSSDKAIKELGYTITPVEVALGRTIQYLNSPTYAS